MNLPSKIEPASASRVLRHLFPQPARKGQQNKHLHKHRIYPAFSILRHHHGPDMPT